MDPPSGAGGGGTTPPPKPWSSSCRTLVQTPWQLGRSGSRRGALPPLTHTTCSCRTRWGGGQLLGNSWGEASHFEKRNGFLKPFAFLKKKINEKPLGHPFAGYPPKCQRSSAGKNDSEYPKGRWDYDLTLEPQAQAQQTERSIWEGNVHFST